MCKVQFYNVQAIDPYKKEPRVVCTEQNRVGVATSCGRIHMWVTANQSKISCIWDYNMSSVVEHVQSREELYHCVWSKVWVSIQHIVVQRVAGKGQRAVWAIGCCNIVVVSSPALVNSSYEHKKWQHSWKKHHDNFMCTCTVCGKDAQSQLLFITAWDGVKLRVTWVVLVAENKQFMHVSTIIVCTKMV